MTEPAYLYGYGSKRHIANPDHALPDQSYCGASGENEARMVKTLRRWNPDPYADRYIAQHKARQVCKLCQRAWEKRP